MVIVRKRNQNYYLVQIHRQRGRAYNRVLLSLGPDLEVFAHRFYDKKKRKKFFEPNDLFNRALSQVNETYQVNITAEVLDPHLEALSLKVSYKSVLDILPRITSEECLVDLLGGEDIFRDFDERIGLWRCSRCNTLGYDWHDLADTLLERFGRRLKKGIDYFNYLTSEVFSNFLVDDLNLFRRMTGMDGMVRHLCGFCYEISLINSEIDKLGEQLRRPDMADRLGLLKEDIENILLGQYPV
ncbi:MAG: hypothetical protein HQK57_00305 [Deltaproteobacteria bacterium]|nr:hypothetical protein [Deltaproteobacteria bacterium]